MKILFLCTAFNSLSQRTALVLRQRGHAVTVEYALSAELMIEAAHLAKPDLVICPFLTKRVPRDIYTTWMTLIVHPGPPGDAGPSALDWCLMGDMGEFADAEQQLSLIDAKHCAKGTKPNTRSHWGVTVLQAIEAFDAGPVWAFDQFEMDQQVAAMTKSDLYRGPVTRAALNAVLAAVERIMDAAASAEGPQSATSSQNNKESRISATLAADPRFRSRCVSNGVPFLGGRTHDRPLLKASSRDFVPLISKGTSHLSADAIVQRINSADSQPGMLSSLFETPLFLYNAHIQRDPLPPSMAAKLASSRVGSVLATREGAVLVHVGAEFPLWIAHLRRPKAKTDKYLHPKLPAVMALKAIPGLASRLGLFSEEVQEWSATDGFGCDPDLPWKRRPGTYQQVWVDIESSPTSGAKIAYIHSDFYNGAFSTLQCEILLSAMRWALAQPGLKAITMLGGPGYFSNGIALNVIEGSTDPSAEGWANINAIDDCVQNLIAPKGIVTFSALRGNAAAGGLAMATAADFVICAESAVLNPHYRGLGLFGSEWHTYSWYERCGSQAAAKFAKEMLPMSAHQAKEVGLVDHIVENDGLSAAQLLTSIKDLVGRVMDAQAQDAARAPAGSILSSGAPWTRSLRPASVGSSAMFADEVLKNKGRYLAYLFADDKDSGTLTLEANLQKYRSAELGQMIFDFFHPHRNQRFASRCTGFVRKLVPTSTPYRFALHRRVQGGNWWEMPSHAAILRLDEEELDAFDGLADIPASAAVPRLPSGRPELIQQAGFVVNRDATRMTRTHSSGQETLGTESGSDHQQSEQEASTAPTSPRGSIRAVLSLRDEEAKRSQLEAEQLKVKDSPTEIGSAVKKSPNVISFANVDGAEKVVAEQKPEMVKSRSQAGVESQADLGQKKVSRIQRFFKSFGRKSKLASNLSSTGTDSQAQSSPSSNVSVEQRVHGTSVREVAEPADNTVATTTPRNGSWRQSRRSSVSDLVAMIHKSDGIAPGVSATKAERRKSWRPSSSSSLANGSNDQKSLPTTPPIAKAGGFEPDMTATPKILEEGFTQRAVPNDLPSQAQQNSNCLFSCYYAEDGTQQQAELARPVVTA